MPSPSALENEILLKRACPSCGSMDSRLRFTTSDFMLGLEGAFHASRCSSCGLLFQNPSLRPEHLGRHYPDDYGPYNQEESPLGRTVAWHLRNHEGYGHIEATPSLGLLARAWGAYSSRTQLLPRFVQGGKALEIACASGNRLELLRRLGWSECTGIEFSESAAQLARNRGFTVRAGRVEDAIDAIPDGSQDTVIASFVLEHLENPFELVRRIADKLKPGGQFLFSTLNIGSLDFRMYRKYWYDLDLPRHYTFFRKSDILRMLGNRFAVDGIHHQAAPQDFLGSARYRMKYEPRLVDRAILALGNRLMPACLGLAMLGLTTRICVHARKV